MTTSPIPIPDYGNDTLKYRFTNSGERSYLNTIYDIERSINGGPFVKIGTVVKTRDGSWNESASWTAKSRDGELGVTSSTRDGAAQSLEYRLQGPEFHERQMAEYHAGLKLDAERKDAEQAAALARVDAIVRTPANSAMVDKLHAFVVKGSSLAVREFTAEEVLILLEGQA